MQRAFTNCALRGRPVHRESHAQRALFRWMRRQGHLLPGLDLGFAIPNGAFLQGGPEQRRKRWAQLKAEGARSGVADIFIPVPRGRYHGLWVELKAEKPHHAKVSKEQAEWLLAMGARGYGAIVCYGKDEAIEAILKYFELGEFHG